MEAAGFLAADRTSHEDRRRVGLSVTEAGHALLATLTEKRRQRTVERLALLSADERDAVRIAVDALERTTSASARTNKEKIAV